MDVKKPHVFIVGEPKTGTSSLVNYLSEHEEVFFASIEPQYFCKDFHEESEEFHAQFVTYRNKDFFPVKSKEEYLSLFEEVSDEEIVGEKSANYLYSEVAAENIYDFNPEAKIIMLFREPVSFLRSLHSQFLRGTNEVEEDFKKALGLEEERKEGEKIPKAVRCPSFLFYSDWIKYADQIERFLEFFSKEQIKVIIFDDFVNDTEGAYEDILSFLELENTASLDFSAHNQHKEVFLKSLRQLLSNPVLLNSIRSILPKKLFNKLKDWFLDFTLVKKERESLDPVYRKSLMKKFKSEVKKLNEVLHENHLVEQDKNLVELWGYDEV